MQKLKFYQEILPMPGKPGLFMVVKQWVENGPLHTDNNDGKGYSSDEAIAKLWVNIIGVPTKGGQS